MLELSVSIVVPCKQIGEYERECLKGCLGLDYANFEVLILPDGGSWETSGMERVRVIETGHVSPAMKRNIGIKEAKGKLIAFIDSDAFPDQGWLRNASRWFTNPHVGAVGGPSITPPSDSPRQKGGGLVLSSMMGGGGLSHRYAKQGDREVDDIPTCNIIVRRSVVDRLGGFNRDYWPGEDTYLCLQIKTHLGLKLIYAPDVVVYHHRRPLFRGHLKQIWSYGLHRGYFARKFPENSRKIIYFAPSLVVLGLTVGALFTLIHPLLQLAYILGGGIYLGICFFEGIKTRNSRMAVLVAGGIILTHLAYGVAFLKGIASRRLKEDKYIAK